MHKMFKMPTIGNLPAEAGKRWGEREALVFEDRRWTYAEFDREVNRVAAALIASGVQKGENVAVWLPNKPEFVFLIFGIIKAGAVLVPLNIRYRANDLAYALKQSDTCLLVTTAQGGPVDLDALVIEVLGEVTPQEQGMIRSSTCPRLRRVIYLEGGNLPGASAWPDFLQSGAEVPAETIAERAAGISHDDTAIIMYTSGTTGEAKGVMLDHSAVAAWTDKALAMGMTAHDIQLNYMPLFHVHSISWILGQCLVTGAKQILMETFDRRRALQLIEKEKVTVTHGFDTHWQDLLDELDTRTYDLASLRVSIFASGLENTVAIALKVQERIGRTVGAYGMTETWAGVTLTPLDATLDQRCRATGYPLPGFEVRVVDPATGHDVPIGEQGEILVRGYTLMRGYYGMPDASRAMFDEDGWLHTGDAGILRADGHLRFVGRYKDMLKVGGENVSPAEIESLLLKYPGIEQVAVVGMPDPRLKEVAAAFVVCAAGVVADEAAMIASLRGKVASFKIPRKIIQLESLPMTPSGKIQKGKLRDQLAVENRIAVAAAG